MRFVNFGAKMGSRLYKGSPLGCGELQIYSPAAHAGYLKVSALREGCCRGSKLESRFSMPPGAIKAACSTNENLSATRSTVKYF